MLRQDVNGDECKVMQSLRVLADEEPGFDAPTIAFDLCRLGIDDAGELLNRLLILPSVYEQLSVL